MAPGTTSKRIKELVNHLREELKIIKRALLGVIAVSKPKKAHKTWKYNIIVVEMVWTK
jgi:hypothetical protein